MKAFSNRHLVLIAGIIVNICIGTGYAWSVYQVGLFNESVWIFGHQLTEAQLALTFTICSAIAPICMIVGEPLQKLLGGPRAVVWLGGACFGGGLILSGVLKSIFGLYISYGLVTGFGLSLTYGIIIDNAVKIFSDKHGFVAGVTTAAFGVGSIIFPPIIERIMSRLGVQSAFVILGVIFAVLIIGFGTFVNSPPERIDCGGGAVDDKSSSPPQDLSNNSHEALIDRNWKQMLLDFRFWLMFAAFTIFATGGLMVITQGAQIIKAFGVFDQALAAAVVSIIAVGNTLGRIIWGFCSDKLGRYNTLIIMAGCVGLLGFSGFLCVKLSLLVPFILCAVLIAACYGGSMGVYPALTADVFGQRHNGINYGIMFTGFAVAAFLALHLRTDLIILTRFWSLVF